MSTPPLIHIGGNELILPDDFNWPLQFLDLTPVKKLSIGAGYHQPFDNLDLKGVEELCLSIDANFYSDRGGDFLYRNVFSGLELKNVKTLILDEYYELSDLIFLDLRNVDTIIFSYGNQIYPSDKMNWGGVKNLIVRCRCMSELIVPKGIIFLSFEGNFDNNRKDISDIDLQDLKVINFGWGFERDLTRVKWKGVEEITVSENNPHFSLKNIKKMNFENIHTINFLTKNPDKFKSFVTLFRKMGIVFNIIPYPSIPV